MPSSMFSILAMDSTSKWLLVCAGALTLIYAVLRPMRKKKDPLEAGPNYSSLAQQRSVERQMGNLLVDLSEMARQITGQLDTRAAKLELLIKEADEKLAALKAATQTPGASPPANGQPAPRTPPPAIEPDAAHLEVYALADQGCAAAEIARRLSRPNGEIELILALRSHG